VLQTRLAETVEEGHKAVVFSRLTSLLALLRSRRVPAGSVVEPRRPGPGDRPRAPRRADAPRLRHPPDRARHREEKVLELQHAKRDPADAIITEDNSVIANIEPEDLEFLLS
jgi:SNF2 family DNA or RNA helicase